MKNTTFTFKNGVRSSDGTFSWDSASNWSPAGVTYDPNFGYSTDVNSFTMGNIGIGPYVATFGDNSNALGDSFDQVDDLIINYGGATLTQFNGAALVVGGSISVLAGTLDLGDAGEIRFEHTNSGQFNINGVLQGSGTVDNTDPELKGNGTIIALDEHDGSSLDLGSRVDNGLKLQVGAGAIMEVTAVQSGVTITVENGSSGVVQLDNLAGFHGTIAGLNVGHGANTNPGSYLLLTNIGAVSGDTATLTGATIANDVITLKYGAVTLGTIDLAGSLYAGDFVNWVPDAATHGLFTDVFLSDSVCYLAGTHILTPGGTVPVESLCAGDQVIAVVDGQRVARAVKWAGHRKLELDRHRNAAELAPIRFKRGALGENLPVRDLLVSPPHGMHIDGKLIPAKLLVNGMTIVRATDLKVAAYYHIELDRHALLIAEGVEAESYLDTGNRAFFSNGGLALMLHPEFHVNAGLRCWETDACAPLAVSPAAVEPVWRALAERAVVQGYVAVAEATTVDADIHLLADGRRIDPVAVAGEVYTFMIRAGVGSVEIASRAAVPSDLVPYMDDPREIGVAVSGIVVRGRTDHRTYPADHPALTRGWHAPEGEGTAVWRWTNGRGVLPVDTMDGPVIVDVRVCATTTYPQTMPHRAAA